MSELVCYNHLLRAWFLLAAVMFVVLMRLPAPYGRHATAAWGPTVNARLGWLLMESPASLLFLMWYVIGINRTPVALVFLLIWQAHYVERAFHYPFTLGDTARPMPVLVVLFGMLFNSVNTYLNARHLFTFSSGYDVSWLADPRFLAGALLLVAGYILNRHSDRRLAQERSRTGARYCQLDGGLFGYVCCPNYLGETLIWIGWAVATWSLAGLSFAIWTAANLLPRARAHLRWCREHLEGYPDRRRAMIPGLW